MRLDRYKLMHWMNARKVTPGQVADRIGTSRERLTALLEPGEAAAEADEVAALADVLSVSPEQLAASPRRELAVITRSAAELRATRRPIQRDGIHFYNYYSMAAPPGSVAPVILDILCPPERLPALNNGHLEPAITVNLGPGDIHGRWGEELDEATWQVLRANRGADRWIVGDTYVEPSFCPHSYSLAGEEPARIVSYTGQSNLAHALEDVNDWSAPAADALLAWLGDADVPPLAIAELLLARRGHTLETAAKSLRLSPGELTAALDPGVADGVGIARTLGRTYGFDYRVLLPAQRRHDAVGKTYATVEEARAGARTFRGYEVASMASAPHLPDLTGLFVRVDSAPDTAAELDLVEPAETHYLVVDGEPVLEWAGAARTERRALEPDASAWVAPFVAHGWSGTGSLIKLGSGSHIGYLDLFELSNTYAPGTTLRRGRRDALGWGYDR